MSETGSVTGRTSQDYVDLLARSTAAPGQDGLESTTRAPELAATDGNRRELLDRLRTEIAYVERMTGMPVDRDAVDHLLGQADHGLRRLFAEGADATLSDDAAGGLEAVVRTDGSRPVLFVVDDFVDLQAPSIGGYAAGLARIEGSVRRVCRSVGRVDDPTASLLTRAPPG